MNASSSIVLAVLGCLLIFLGTSATLAQTSSANSTDFAGFVAPGTNGVNVNEVTGAFSFSKPVITIPNSEGEDYTLTLDYHTPGPDEEASWVGLGWRLSPGAISRMQQGYPDDYCGDTIVNFNKTPANVRQSMRAVYGQEVASVSQRIAQGSVWDSDRGVSDSYNTAVGVGVLGYSANYSGSEFGAGGSYSEQFNPLMGVWNSVCLAASVISMSKGGGGSSYDNWWKASGEKLAMRYFGPTGQYNTSLLRALSGSTTMQNGVKWDGFNKQMKLGMPIYQSDVSTTIYPISTGAQFNLVPLSGQELGIEGELIITTIDPFTKLKAYGFMHSGKKSLDDNDAVQDFRDDKLQALDRYDKFISMPIATPDVFTASSQGIGGSFRAYHSQPGHFFARKPYQTYDDQLLTGIEIDGGLTPPNIGAGASFVKSKERWLKLLEWSVEDDGKDNPTPLRFSDRENRLFFAFENDPVGFRKYGGDNGVIRPVEENGRAVFGSALTEEINPYAPIEFQELIRSNLRADWDLTDGGSTGFAHYKRFERNPVVNAYVDGASVGDSSLTEFQILDKDGRRHNYGLPVYAKNQFSLNFSLLEDEATEFRSTGAKAYDMGYAEPTTFLKEQVIVGDAYTPNIDELIHMPEKVGSEKNAIINGTLYREPVANEFLLTSVLGSNYIDLNGDGPTDDDLGSWVRFEYERTTDWFKFRSPHYGAHFSRGDISDPRDDVGSVSGGEKEIYEIKEIETKSHRAKFYCSARMDGHGVSVFADPASAGAGGQLCKLDSVQLCTKGSTETLIQTIHFNYDYSMCNGFPGNTSGGGKLTLKSIHSTYGESIKEESRHEFEYNYPDASAIQATYGELPTSYVEMLSEFKPTTGAPDENPAYDDYTTDAWGMMAPEPSPDFWMHHETWTPAAEYRSGNGDPAAYFLKQIHMPSGLSIFPQFERGDYGWCMDERALELMPIVHLGTSSTNLEVQVDLTPHVEEIQASKPGIDIAAVLNTWGEFYTTHFGNNDQLLLVNLLKVAEDNGHAPQAGRKRFFEVFATVQATNLIGNVLTLTCSLEDGSTLEGVGRDWQIANPNLANAFSDFELYDKGDVARAKAVLFYKISQGEYFDYPDVEVDLDHTYARIPVPIGASKAGGPTRLKRLLTLDRGISLENGDAMMFGTEYRYTAKDQATAILASSGVATNEPNGRFIEHPHFLPLPKRPQSASQRLLAGEDLERLRGPIGSSFFPSPHITYEQVTKLYLHPYNDVNEFEVSKFFSHRTHPIRIEWSNPDKTQWERPCCEPEEGFLSFSHRWELSFAQGFKVTKSAFPGLEISRMRYFGDIDDPARWAASTGHRNYYTGSTVDGEIPTLDHWTLEDRELGRWEELYIHGRTFDSFRKTVTHELDLNFSWPPFPPFFIPLPSYIPMTSEYREIQSTLSTTHVITEPARLSMVVQTNLGKESVSQHLAFDRYTGRPTTTATTDGFLDDSGELRRLISHAVPASHIHEEMGPASVNDRKVMLSNQLDFQNVVINKLANNQYLEILPLEDHDLCNGVSGVNLMDYFYPGDLIKIFDDSNPYDDAANDDYWYVNRVIGNLVYIEPTIHLAYKTFNRCEINVEILQSGRTNELGAPSMNYAVADHDLDWQTVSKYTPAMAAFIANANAQLSAITALPSSASTYHNVATINDNFLELNCEVTPGEDGLKLTMYAPDCLGGAGIQIADISAGPTFLHRVHVADPSHHGEVGHLEWNDELGAIVWVTPDNPCNFVQLLTACEDLSLDRIVENVISASATQMADTLTYETPAPLGTPEGERRGLGELGRWAPRASLVFDDSTTSILGGTGTKTYEAGLVPEMVVYKFHRQDVEQEGWIPASTSDVFSMDGVSIQNQDALGNKESVCFGHDERLTLWTLMNGGFDEAYYQSFEDWEGSSTKKFNGGAFPLALPASQAARHNDNKSHSGQMSYQLIGSSAVLGRYIGTVRLGESARESGLRLRFWAHHPTPGGVAKLDMDSVFTAELSGCSSGDPDTGILTGSCGSSGTSSGEVVVTKLASTGEWQLFQALFDSTFIADSGYNLGDQLDIILKSDFSATPAAGSGGSSGSGSGSFGGSAPALVIKTIYLDDIRIQPTYSAMTCSAYDPERLVPVAQFNENHFGSFYQYNLRNELVRKRIETLGGIKTTSEQYLHFKTN